MRFHCISIVHWLSCSVIPVVILSTVLSCCVIIIVTGPGCTLLTRKLATLQSVRAGENDWNHQNLSTFNSQTTCRNGRAASTSTASPPDLQEKQNSVKSTPFLLLRKGNRRRTCLCQFNRRCSKGVRERDPVLGQIFQSLPERYLQKGPVQLTRLKGRGNSATIYHCALFTRRDLQLQGTQRGNAVRPFSCGNR